MLNEKAHVVFALLNESYKLEASEQLSMLTIITAPHANTQDYKQIFNTLQRASGDMIDVFDDGGAVGVKELKKLLKY